MFKVISEITPYCYDMLNSFSIAINFCNAKKMNFALMFIIRYHCGRKCLSDQLQLEPCIDMFKVISDIMAHRHDELITFNIAIMLRNLKKMNCALMFSISNHCGRKCLSDLLQLEPCNDNYKVISEIMKHCHDT